MARFIHVDLACTGRETGGAGLRFEDGESRREGRSSTQHRDDQMEIFIKEKTISFVLAFLTSMQVRAWQNRDYGDRCHGSRLRFCHSVNHLDQLHHLFQANGPKLPTYQKYLSHDCRGRHITRKIPDRMPWSRPIIPMEVKNFPDWPVE